MTAIRMLAVVALVTGIAATATYAATSTLFPRAGVTCGQYPNKQSAGYSVGCARPDNKGLSVWIDRRDVAVVDNSTGRAIFKRPNR